MEIRKIWQEKINGLYGAELLLSTVKLGDVYETALIFEDGGEVESETFNDLDAALAFHDTLRVRCWKDVREAYPFTRDTPFERVVEEIYFDADAVGA